MGKMSGQIFGNYRMFFFLHTNRFRILPESRFNLIREKTGKSKKNAAKKFSCGTFQYIRDGLHLAERRSYDYSFQTFSSHADKNFRS